MTEHMAPRLRKLLADTPALHPLEINAILNPDPNAKPLGFQAQAKAAAEGVDERPAVMYWIKFCDAYPDFEPGEILCLWSNDCSAEKKGNYI